VLWVFEKEKGRKGDKETSRRESQGVGNEVKRKTVQEQKGAGIVVKERASSHVPQVGHIILAELEPVLQELHHLIQTGEHHVPTGVRHMKMVRTEASGN